MKLLSSFQLATFLTNFFYSNGAASYFTSDFLYLLRDDMN